jgi:hypothetical protein
VSTGSVALASPSVLPFRGHFVAVFDVVSVLLLAYVIGVLLA